MYYDQIETWYDVYKSDLKKVFCHHYMAYWPIFGQKMAFVWLGLSGNGKVAIKTGVKLANL